MRYEVVLKKNIFNTFLEKIFDFPLWIKQVIYLKLAEEMRNNYCEDFLQIHKDDIFSTFIPTLTFKGETELKERKCGLDNNTYNFLDYCSNGYNILEISINTFLSMEETAKYYEFCLEQNFVKAPESQEIQAMAGYIAGKLRLGEYLNQKKFITDEQLLNAINIKKSNPQKMFGNILIELGYITDKDLKALLILKQEAQRRFILDYNTVPKSQIQYMTQNQQYEDEINTLKNENIELKRKMRQLTKIIK